MKEEIKTKIIEKFNGVEVGSFVKIQCPYCLDRGGSWRRRKCYVSVERFVFYCYRCDAGRGVRLDKLLRDFRIAYNPTWLNYLEPYKMANGAPFARPHSYIPYDELTEGSSPRAAIEAYFAEHKVSNFWKYQIGYCPFGKFAKRMIIPVVDDYNRWVYFQARALDDDTTPKYLNPNGPKPAYLFGLSESLAIGDGVYPLVLCEGAATAMRLHQLDVPAVALLGKTLTAEQHNTIRAAGFRRLLPFFDFDARMACEFLALKLPEAVGFVARWHNSELATDDELLESIYNPSIPRTGVIWSDV